MDPIILHCDLNNFYASVECLERPELRDVPLVVGGDETKRRGVVVAKNQIAKELGIKTGDTVFQARRICPEIVVLRSNIEKYLQYSKKVQQVYKRYTDLVEPFSLDECWLDASQFCRNSMNEGKALADALRSTLKKELGLSISVGVSFNKVFSKLGSDYKKPDATTLITRKNFKFLLWPLPARSLLFVGAVTAARLKTLGIATIGDLARANPALLEGQLGSSGRTLFEYANGLDNSPVLGVAEQPNAKSIGAHMTLSEDITTLEQARPIFYALSDRITRELRSKKLVARTVQITVKTSNFKVYDRQASLNPPSQLSSDFVRSALSLLNQKVLLARPIRLLGVSATGLQPENQPEQLDLFGSTQERDRKKALTQTLDQINERYGQGAIKRGIFLPPTDETDKE